MVGREDGQKRSERVFVLFSFETYEMEIQTLANLEKSRDEILHTHTHHSQLTKR